MAALLAAAPGRGDDWPQHLGPHRDGTSAEAAPAAWPAGGPAILWRRPMGRSFAAPAVAGDRVFLFHRKGDQTLLECLDAGDGAPVWTWSAPTTYRDDFGFSDGPRATPTVSGDSVYVFGADGALTAVDRASGKHRWSVPTHERFGVEKGFFGAAASPLVVGDQLFLNVGGRGAGMVAFATADGAVRWSVGDDRASYSSAVATSFGGQPAVVFFTRAGVAVVGARDGAVYARFALRSRSNASVNAATPLLSGDRVFATASYGTGAALLELGSSGLQPVWRSDDALSSHYATPVLARGLAYGFHGRQEYGPSLRCIQLETGAVKWSVDRFGAGSVTLVGDRLLVLREDGRLVLAPASERGFEPIAEARLLAPTVRALPAYANGVLYAHDERELIAARLR